MNNTKIGKRIRIGSKLIYRTNEYDCQNILVSEGSSPLRKRKLTPVLKIRIHGIELYQTFAGLRQESISMMHKINNRERKKRKEEVTL